MGLKRSDVRRSEKLRNYKAGAGIARFIKDLSNPLNSAWEARTLPLSYARSLRFSAALPVQHAARAIGAVSMSA